MYIFLHHRKYNKPWTCRRHDIRIIFAGAENVCGTPREIERNNIRQSPVVQIYEERARYLMEKHYQRPFNTDISK